MKISIDKDFTTISQAPKVKNDLKEFKARYTDGDGEPTHFVVDMLVDEKYIEIDRIHFYCDMNLDVHLETTFNGQTHKMYDVERYIRQR